MFTAAYKTTVINLWLNTFPVLATQHRVAASEDVKDLPAFVKRNSGWLRSYQSWTKKRNQKAANVCITRFNKTVDMDSYRTSQAC